LVAVTRQNFLILPNKETNKQANKQTTNKQKTKTKVEQPEPQIKEIILLHLNIYHVIWVQDISDLDIMVYRKVPDDNEIVPITA